MQPNCCRGYLLLGGEMVTWPDFLRPSRASSAFPSAIDYPSIALHNRNHALLQVCNMHMPLITPCIVLPLIDNPVQLLQDPHEPSRHDRAQEWHPYPGDFEISRPIPQHQARRYRCFRPGQIPTSIVGKEHVHSWQRGAVCDAAAVGGWCWAFGGCDTERYGYSSYSPYFSGFIKLTLIDFAEAANQAGKARWFGFESTHIYTKTYLL